MRARAVVLLLAVVAGGCLGIGREYVWTRKEPAIFRRHPTTFTVRITADRTRREVRRILTATDADGEINREIETFGDCAIYDDSNWECTPLVDPDSGTVLHRIWMRDGRLREVYWGEQRDYRTVYRIFK